MGLGGSPRMRTGEICKCEDEVTRLSSGLIGPSNEGPPITCPLGGMELWPQHIYR